MFEVQALVSVLGLEDRWSGENLSPNFIPGRVAIVGKTSQCQGKWESVRGKLLIHLYLPYGVGTVGVNWEMAGNSKKIGKIMEVSGKSC